MPTDFDRKTIQDPITRVNDPMTDLPRSSGMARYGIAAAVAVAVALGLLFWNMSDQNTAGLNKAPGVTTGSSSTASPSNPPPATGLQQGQGQSNSMR